MNCSTPFGATRAYETLFSSTGIHHDDRAHMISLEMFTHGFYVFGFATDLPLVVTSSSPSLEERRLLPFHQSVGQAISYSGKVMRSLVGIYGDVSEVMYPFLVSD